MTTAQPMSIIPETFNGLVGTQALCQLGLLGTLLGKQGWGGSHPLRKEEIKRKRKTRDTPPPLHQDVPGAVHYLASSVPQVDNMPFLKKARV